MLEHRTEDLRVVEVEFSFLLFDYFNDAISCSRGYYYCWYNSDSSLLDILINQWDSVVFGNNLKDETVI